MEQGKTIEDLFERYLNNECSPEQVNTLLQHFGIEKNQEHLRKLIREAMETSVANEMAPTSSRIEGLLKNTFSKIKERIHHEEKGARVRVMLVRKRTWYLIAASITALLLSSAVYFLIFSKKENQIVATQSHFLQNKNNDIQPGKNNAVLTLDDGTTIVLDSAANGTLATQGNIKVLKLNGQIAYNKSGSMNAKPVYNTITTANGNQYQLILTDGTKVWLNAASSIRFPTSFTGNERKIEITGEAYFEVSKDPTRPFRVFFTSPSGPDSHREDGAEIEVLGTHFNVNTYLDEPEMRTTLLEGSIKIKNSQGAKMLVPGEQARLTSKGIEIKKNVDINHVMAWKNGYFLFDNTDIYTLMRQVSRWYNVSIKYEGNVTEEGFTGKISREVPLSTFIKVLKLNDVNVTTEGRTMIVGLSVLNK